MDVWTDIQVKQGMDRWVEDGPSVRTSEGQAIEGWYGRSMYVRTTYRPYKWNIYGWAKQEMGIRGFG